MAVVAAPRWAPALLGVRTRRFGQQLLVWLAVRGCSQQDVHDLLKAVAADYVGPRRHAHRDGVAAVRAHLDAGHHVVIATERWDLLTVALGEAMGLQVPAHSSTSIPAGTDAAAMPPTSETVPRRHDDPLRPGYRADAASDASTGETGHRAPVGEVQIVAEELGTAGWRHLRMRAHYKDGKVAALRRAGITFPVAAAYSDSLADLLLLARAQMPHVVNASWRQRRRLVRAVGGYTTDHWHVEHAVSA